MKLISTGSANIHSSHASLPTPTAVKHTKTSKIIVSISKSNITLLLAMVAKQPALSYAGLIITVAKTGKSQLLTKLNYTYTPNSN